MIYTMRCEQTTRSLSVLIMLMLAGPAAAQSDSRFSVGPGVTFFESTGKFQFGPAVRGRRAGFGPTLGFNWHTTEVEPGAVGLAAPSELRVRPVMAGLSHTTIRGRFATTVAVVGGYSFNRISTTESAAEPPVDLRVENSLAWAPVVTLGMDLNRKFGLMATASYLVTRPQVTITSAGRETRSRLHADSLVVLVGVVVGLF